MTSHTPPAGPLGHASAELLEQLERLAEDHPDGGRVVHAKLTELAALCGKTPGTIADQLKRLQHRGLIDSYAAGKVWLRSSRPPAAGRGADGVVDGAAAAAAIRIVELCGAYPEHTPTLLRALALVTGTAGEGSAGANMRELASSTAVLDSVLREHALLQREHRETARGDREPARDIANERPVTPRDEIEAACADLVEFERAWSNPHAGISNGAARYLGRYTPDELRHACTILRGELEAGRVRTAVGALVGAARSRVDDLFDTTRPIRPPMTAGERHETVGGRHTQQLTSAYPAAATAPEAWEEPGSDAYVPDEAVSDLLARFEAAGPQVVEHYMAAVAETPNSLAAALAGVGAATVGIAAVAWEADGAPTEIR